MVVRFSESARQFSELDVALIPGEARPLFIEMVESVGVLAQRAVLIKELYDYSFGIAIRKPQEWLDQRLRNAREAISKAQALVDKRQQMYRLPLDRLAGWRRNPTVYRFMYLWATKTLYFWWRDYIKASTLDGPWSQMSPCHLNVHNPILTAQGAGALQDAAQFIRDMFEGTRDISMVTNCLAAPRSEPTVKPE